jgi:hypothetical protein
VRPLLTRAHCTLSSREQLLRDSDEVVVEVIKLKIRHESAVSQVVGNESNVEKGNVGCRGFVTRLSELQR